MGFSSSIPRPIASSQPGCPGVKMQCDSRRREPAKAFTCSRARAIESRDTIFRGELHRAGGRLMNSSASSRWLTQRWATSSRLFRPRESAGADRCGRPARVEIRREVQRPADRGAHARILRQHRNELLISPDERRQCNRWHGDSAADRAPGHHVAVGRGASSRPVCLRRSRSVAEFGSCIPLPASSAIILALPRPVTASWTPSIRAGNPDRSVLGPWAGGAHGSAVTSELESQ
jgi:hypothetical protein